MRRIVDLDWQDIETALRDQNGTETYIDVETGDLIRVAPGFSDEAQLRSTVEDDRDRYLRLPVIDTAFAHRVMLQFIDSIADNSVKAELQRAFGKTGPYTRCIGVLQLYPPLLAAFRHKEKRALWRHFEAYLRAHSMAPSTPPPDMGPHDEQ